uniref:Uncharacterized protein n=1 Tax=Romanomermis culicivorax TaxID=13658 RepID=A0A915K029_ROMCU
MQKLIAALKGSKKPLIFCMVHLRALPGTPQNLGTIDSISKKAVEEAQCYAKYGIDGIIVENMGDVPYVQSSTFSPETIAFMTRCAIDIKNSLNCCGNLFFGINLLASRNREALAVALSSGYDFIRCEGYVFAHVADEGFTNACAGDLLRYRKLIGAENVSVLADIKKKHSAHAITADVDLIETAESAKFFLADAVVVTGTMTGKAADPKEVSEIRSSIPELPIFVGSGVTTENVNQFMNASGLIVGSHFKKDGHWSNELDEKKISTFMESFRKANK